MRRKYANAPVRDDRGAQRLTNRFDHALVRPPMQARVTCACCGAETFVAIEWPNIGRALIDHKPDCFYFAAIEAGAALAFVMRFGNPIDIEALPIAGTA